MLGSLSGILWVFHGHLILLMWRDIYEEREGRVLWDVRASPRVYQILLDKSCVLPISKKICQVKKELISNSLA